MKTSTTSGTTSPISGASRRSTFLRLLLTGTLIATLANGCAPDSGRQGRVCGVSLEPQILPPVQPSDYEKAARACVERWAARLATGPDPINLIADTVVATCHQEIERLEDGTIVSFGQVKPLEPQVRAYWHGHAMLIGAQVRAAGCYSDA